MQKIANKNMKFPSSYVTVTNIMTRKFSCGNTWMTTRILMRVSSRLRVQITLRKSLDSESPGAYSYCL